MKTFPPQMAMVEIHKRYLEAVGRMAGAFHSVPMVVPSMSHEALDAALVDLACIKEFASRCVEQVEAAREVNRDLLDFDWGKTNG